MFANSRGRRQHIHNWSHVHLFFLRQLWLTERVALLWASQVKEMFIRAFSSRMPFIKTRFAGIDCRPVKSAGCRITHPCEWQSASSLVLVGAHLNFTQVIGDLMKFFPPLQLHNPQSQLMKPRSEKSFACCTMKDVWPLYTLLKWTWFQVFLESEQLPRCLCI